MFVSLCVLCAPVSGVAQCGNITTTLHPSKPAATVPEPVEKRKGDEVDRAHNETQSEEKETPPWT